MAAARPRNSIATAAQKKTGAVANNRAGVVGDE